MSHIRAVTRAAIVSCLLLGASLLPAQVEVRGSEWVRLRSAARLIFGWQVGIAASSFPQATFFEAVDRAADPLFLRVIEGSAAQKVSAEIPKNLDASLSAEEIEAVKRKLAGAGVRVLTYSAGAIGADEASARKLFEFAKALHVGTLVAKPPAGALPLIDRLSEEYGVQVAIEGGSVGELEGRSERIGIAADLSHYPAEGLTPLKSRLRSVHLQATKDLAREVAELNQLDIQPLIMIVDAPGPGDPTANLSKSLLELETALQQPAGERVAKLSLKTPIKGPERLPAEVREKIAAAVPGHAPAKPKKLRKMLIMDLTVAYPPTDHLDSGSAANLALRLAAEKTGAFEAVFSNDISNLRYDKLKQFDAVYLNNTVGEVFPDPMIRESLLRFVREGGGLAGHHGSSHAGQDWPEFGEMLGARGGTHKTNHETVAIKIDDPDSPINASFHGKGFDFTDEFYRFQPGPPYSRDNLHILLSFDVARTDMNQSPACARCLRPDNDYAISWIRSYGKGRVFYISLGHNPWIFMTPSFFEHVLAGIQFVLGDLEADTTPSARLARAER
jgi:type 1 glutamine amidotransferase